DSVFYGYGLGLGMGCTMAFGTIYYLGTAIAGATIAGAEGGPVDIQGYIWLLLISLSYVFILSAIGTTIGEGIARLRPMEFALQSIFVNAVFSLILWSAYVNSGGSDILFYACIILAFAVAAVYFYYTMYVKLSGVVRDVLKMEGKTRKDVPK
ncbi:MAG: hypothetical protein FWG60_00245, partial [Methanomassiliicoccaceae archaeon]|nr:hypothetical protein [Methanomassiliicoccaceae archaeon]